MHDILIRGATLYDGSGSPGVPGELSIADGRITAIGPNLVDRARKTIDAKLIDRLGNNCGAVLADGRSYTVKIIRKKGHEVSAHQYPQVTVGTFQQRKSA